MSPAVPILAVQSSRGKLSFRVRRPHTEEAVSFEGLIQHLAISIFKDVERKGAMGEEGAIREKDCTHVLRKFERRHEAGEMTG